MTTMVDVVPAVRMASGPAAGALSAVIQQAAELLAGTGLVHLVGPGEPADVLHTVGDVSDDAHPATRWVHTVDRIPLRGRELVATRRWVRQERNRAARCTVWLTHGHTAGRLVVEAALAPGERVYCLPVLSPWRAPTTGTAQDRADLRRELRIPPGVRLVVGVDSDEPAPALGDWAAAIAALGRTDVQVLRVNGEGRPYPAGRKRISSELPLTGLLAAADLFVATGLELAACSPGVSALAMGLPVVAVTTDSVAELVVSGRNGNVVAPRGDAIAAAVAAHLDAAPPLRRAAGRAADRPVVHQLAAVLLGVYRRALAAPGPARAGRFR